MEGGEYRGNREIRKEWNAEEVVVVVSGVLLVVVVVQGKMRRLCALGVELQIPLSRTWDKRPLFIPCFQRSQTSEVLSVVGVVWK